MITRFNMEFITFFLKSLFSVYKCLLFEGSLMYIINWTKARKNIFLINFALVLLGDFVC